MRIVVLCCALVVAFCPAKSRAQAGSEWSHVQVLPQGTRLMLQTRTVRADCNFVSADAESLTCTHGRQITFQRGEIKSVKVPHRLRSMAIAGAIGGGAGVALGAAVSGKGSFLPRGKSVAAFGAVFGLVGLPIGYGTDFARSTVYRAP